MPKLPDNTVPFDSPLRRTSRPSEARIADADATIATEPASNAAPAELARETPVVALPRSRRETPAAVIGESGLEHRITVRIDDDVNRALELERHERRLAGDKTNVSDVARRVLAAWAKRRLARDRSELA